jgi:TPR repeat protein
MFEKLGKTFASLVRRDPAARLESVERALEAGASTQAFEQLRTLAAAGFAAAEHRLGLAYESAEGVVQSLPDAVYWYRRAAERGHLPSQIRLGLIYFIEPPAPAAFSAPADAEESRSTGADDTDAPEAPPLGGALAQFFPHGVAIRQDFVEALKWNRLAAEAGAAEAQARLGHQLALGLGTDPDGVEAERWFAAAADAGSSAGQLGLGLHYAGSYGAVPDYPRAAHWLTLSAEGGNAIAQYAAAKLRLHGEGVDQDTAAALALLERSAAQDYAPAMYLLGMIRREGQGVAPD